MKTVKLLSTAFIMLTFLFLGTNTFAQKAKKFDEIKVKTNVVCDMCKENVGKILAYEKGVKNFDVDLDHKVITVKYKVKKTNPENIRKAITKAGYYADGQKPDEKAFHSLPKCCQGHYPNHKHEHKHGANCNHDNDKDNKKACCPSDKHDHDKKVEHKHGANCNHNHDKK